LRRYHVTVVEDITIQLAFHSPASEFTDKSRDFNVRQTLTGGVFRLTVIDSHFVTIHFVRKALLIVAAFKELYVQAYNQQYM
jgi:hypothetical protein